jgi:hypothetical protein
MPSTYTLNNGIELIGTGEQSGTWGDTTNTNLGLLDVALDGQVTVALASAGSSGSPNSLPISDGTASNGRNRMVVFSDSGDLGATAYVQLTPNDAEKIIYIRNSLSGSRSVILFQGTYNASNDYEVPAGTTAVVYFDGAGAGAVAANVFNNAYFDGLRLGSVSVTAILDEDNMASDSATALATQQSIKAYVDSQVGTVDTLAEILAIGNTTGATDIAVDSAQKVQFRDAAIYINSSVDGQLDIVADTEIQIGTTLVDLNGNLNVSGTTIVTGVLTTTAATVFNGGITMPDSGVAKFGTGSDLQIYHDAANSYIEDSGTGSLFIRGTSLILEDAGGNDYIAMTDTGTGGTVELKHNAVTKLATTATGIDVTGTVVADGLTVDGVSTLTSNSSADGILLNGRSDNIGQFTFRSNDGATNYSQLQSRSTEMFVKTLANIPMSFHTNNTKRLGIANNGDISFYAADGTTPSFVYDESVGLTINEAGADRDFRVESDANTHALFVQGSDGFVGIGTSSPSKKLAVEGTGVIFNNTGGEHSVLFGDAAYRYFNLYTPASPQYMSIRTASTDLLTVKYDGDVGIGTSSPDEKLHLHGGSNATRMRISGGVLSKAYGGFIEGEGVSGSGGYLRLGVTDNNVDKVGIEILPQGLQLALFTSSTERMRITSVGAVTFNETGADADFRVETSGSSHALFVEGDGTGVGINTSDPQEALHVTGSVRLDGNNNGITSGEAVNQLIFKDTDTTTGGGQTMGQIDFVTADADAPGVSSRISGTADSSTTGQGRLTLFTGAAGTLSNNITMAAGSVAINEVGADMDFRVESDGNANMLFVDGGNNRVGIGRVPSISNSKLEVGGADNVSLINVEASGNTGGMGIGSTGLQLFHGASSKVLIGSGGMVVNEASADYDFRVESDGQTHALFVDAADDFVGINTSDTSYGHVTIVPGGTVNSNIVQSPNTTWGLLALRRTSVSSTVNNTTVDVLRFFKRDGSTIMATSHSSGSVYICVRGGSATNQGNYHYSLQHNGLGATGATFTLVSSSSRGTNPVSSIGVVDDGAGGGIKVQVTYINNSGVVNSGQCRVLFDGLISPS